MARFDSLVLLSGGIESTTILYRLHRERGAVCGITFDAGVAASAGQLHWAKKHIYSIGSYIEIVELPGLPRMVYGHVDPGLLGPDEADMQCPIDSYVPCMITTAIFYAQTARIPNVYVGLTQEQARAHTREFVANIGSIFGKYQEDPSSVTVHAPFIDQSKASVVRLAHSLGLNLAETWSCFRGGVSHCGECASCIDRKQAFHQSGIPDPTHYDPHPYS